MKLSVFMNSVQIQQLPHEAYRTDSFAEIF